MTELTGEQLLEQAMLKLLATTIIKVNARVIADDASPSDIKNALTLLKDNGITLASRKANAPMELGDLTADLIELPFNGVTIDADD